MLTRLVGNKTRKAERSKTGKSLVYDWIKKLGSYLAGYKTLFLIDGIIADETVDK